MRRVFVAIASSVLTFTLRTLPRCWRALRPAGDAVSDAWIREQKRARVI